MRTRTAKALAAIMVVAGTIGGTASIASATQGTPDHSVTICHATASQTNPYVVITVDVASIGDAGHGHSGVNDGDIIPAFNIAGVSYPGHNLDRLPVSGCPLQSQYPNS